MRILFIGDIFGEPGLSAVETVLPQLITRYKVDFVIAQGENVSDRKGLLPRDFARLKKAGVNAVTMGNHIWAKNEIHQIISDLALVRPYNVAPTYPGHGSSVFHVKNKTIRVTSLLGVDFNELRTGWNAPQALNFFDAFDELSAKAAPTDYHVIDFHGEVTSEKAVFALYVDGKVSAVLGTHTHVQTSDARQLPRGTLFMTDAGMTGPTNSAIGANYDEVYRRMRYGEHAKFQTATTPVQFNGVLLTIGKKNRAIRPLNFLIQDNEK